MDKRGEMQKLNSEYMRLPKVAKGWSLSRRFVPGDGPLDAEVMLIGQAPGRNEDIQRKPFVGSSGKFLDRLIHVAGLRRESVYIASVVQFFPPKNRIPTRQEIALCSRFLFRQMKIIRPRFVILLGSVASKTVLGMDKVASNHGRIVRRGNVTYMISMHPAAGIRIRNKMPIIEDDFKHFRGVIMKG
jgi:uracil-DNA glycosylase